MRTPRLLLATVALLGVVATGCAGSDATDTVGSGDVTTGEDSAAGGGGAAGTCLAGAEDCQDTGGDMGAPPPMAMCAEDAPDCEDVIVGDPDAPVTDEPLPADGVDDPAEPEPRMVERTEGLVNLHPVMWEAVDVGDDDQTVTVSWWSGVEPCYALHDVEVSFDEETVTITVIEGSTPDDVACIEIAEYKATQVQLDEPIGPRSIVDGSTG